MIEVRAARVEDAETLAAAEVETARVPGFLVSRPYELKREAFETRIRDLAAAGRYVVAVEDGRIVGHALLEPMPLEALRHVLRLTLVVHPGSRGRGIGRTLMADLLGWAQARPEVGKVELLVRATNDVAIRLYRRCGFVEEGRLRRRLRLPNGEYLDDLTMAWFPEGR
ncbi:MAG: GNAT family N-acetyltransferase [Planctomycetes bacterium]|nr:GNAT family N-acetyltransferase [Planctomycetota bacterium]